MKRPSYKFQIGEEYPMSGVEEALLMSVIAAEGVHGRARVRLDARFGVDLGDRTCCVNSDSPAGEDIAKIFTEFLLLECGDDGFSVEQKSTPCECRPCPGKGRRGR